jgi:DNA excision repair protein ERCC-4
LVSRIVADTREVASGIPAELERRGVYVQRKLLDVADYVVGSYAIERKTVRDFISSLYSGRLFEQAQRIGMAYQKFILIVEGDEQEALSEMKNPNAYWGALLSLTLDFDFKPFFTQNQRETADLLCLLAKRRARGNERPLLVRKPRMGEIRDWQLGVLESLPSIGPKLAEKLLNAFGSVRSVVLASRMELAVKGGIGEERARKIRELIDAEIRTRTKQQKLVD